MKRQKKTVEKRTYALKNAFARYVSLVPRGANLTPFSTLQYNEDGSTKFSDVEINKVVFAKANFEDKAAVEQYLQANDFQEFEIQEDETTFYVLGEDSEKFSEVAPIEYQDGVLYFVGKLLEPTTVEPVGEVVDSEVISHSDPGAEVPAKNPDQTNELEPKALDVTPETVTENAPEAADVVAVEVTAEAPEVVTQSEPLTVVVIEASTVSGSGSIAHFSLEGLSDEARATIEAKFADIAAEIEALKTPIEPVLYTQEQVDELLAKQKEELTAAFELKIEEFNDKTNKVLDEEPIVIQNKQSIQEITELNEDTVAPVKDKDLLKFEQKRIRNIVGY